MSDHVLFADKRALASSLRDKAGLSAGYSSDLANGKRTPSLEVAVLIEDRLGIPAAAWLKRQDINREAAQGEAA